MPRLMLCDGRVFVERVPNAWVYVELLPAFLELSWQDKEMLVRRALASGPDRPTPADPEWTTPRSDQ